MVSARQARSPKMLIELRGRISLSSKMIGVLDKEIVKSRVLEVLDLTKLRVPTRKYSANLS